MDKISGYKDRAIESLTGKWGNSAIAALIYFIIFGGIPITFSHSAAIILSYSTISDTLGNIIQIVLLPIFWGFEIVFLENIRKGDQKIDLDKMFEGFKDYFRIMLTNLLVGIYTLLWTLLLIIPGFIKMYSYSMTNYILLDDPDLKYNSAIEKSMAMMKGHKMDLFLLDLSMIGWFILSIITCGIGLLFLTPYNLTAHAHFYEDLKTEEQQNIAE
ncbi:DUF975 family protein [Segatella paludivivens]|uniref:DUF975 family protein n=1 Tax=Segatella paludivivens TaxID=185294 RepID=UPI0003617DDD|nr:DUF975 family protein [Segatella paludivivens]